MSAEVVHGPDWSNWEPGSDDDDSCLCGYNGSSLECEMSRFRGLFLGSSLRDEGVENTLAADVTPHRDHADTIRLTVARVALLESTFTSDDIHAALPEDCRPHSPNVLPAVIRDMAKKGLIRPVSYTQSSRPSRHAAVIRVWSAAAKQAA